MDLGMKLATSGGQSILDTDRLSLRELTVDDAEFILELVNEPAFVRFIGDKGVRNLGDAKEYLVKGPLASYTRFGFGLWLVQLRYSKESLGICGLIKRDLLPDVDIGYALLERFWAKGYASESAQAVKDYAMDSLGLKRLVAITDQDNVSSIKVLEKIGLRSERLVILSEGGHELKLFAVDR
jgi:RimJ/RimL family protein N-acetyltransferase